ncbi:hypothetical protein NBRC110019_20410 [Neptunitalea chrysea]|uniref:Outer membrane protein beta-barrel domain-containing protein n=1 Tax=Neptunitalea chrysea TaxID=1647581 RepID=A0A9W6EVJ5_9FLAO|nr:outer membrane beta-barrel protein [Neptunitalea chrysea]GLB53001.1 hypothetical protein NBRC110019_20410 [Neptunitalea chrysea]
MKKTYFFMLLLLLAIAPVFSQVQFGARFSANFSKYTNYPDYVTMDSKAKFGQGGSFLLIIPVSEKWIIRPEVGTTLLNTEVNWESYGYNSNGNLTGTYKNSYEANEVMLSFDAMVGYKITDKFTVQVGPELLYSLSASAIFDDVIFVADDYEKTNYLGKIGATYTFWDHMFTDVHYATSVVKLSDDTRRHMIELGIGYTF